MPSSTASKTPKQTIPQPLAQAIYSSALKYGVSADYLTGIWRIESGSTYPNPAVNSSGYGGLFGTRNWNATTQAQADTAASVLAAGLKASGGNYPGALHYYSTGKVSGSGGYTSVPLTGLSNTQYGYTYVGQSGMLKAAEQAKYGTQSPTATDAVNANVVQPAKKAASAVGSALGLDKIGKDIVYALAIGGGGMLILLGLGMIGLDLGLESFARIRQPRVVRETTRRRRSRETGAAADARERAREQARQARERRAEELHAARVKTEQARASELRTRVKHRRRSKQEQEKAERKAFWQGAIEQAAESETSRRSARRRAS